MLDEFIVGARPGFGQIALAALMLEGIVPVVWTTNFDRVVEDAVSGLSGTTTALTTAHLAEPAVARRALDESTFPALVKVHGDYQSENLKNTTTELQEQDADRARRPRLRADWPGAGPRPGARRVRRGPALEARGDHRVGLAFAGPDQRADAPAPRPRPAGARSQAPPGPEGPAQARPAVRVMRIYSRLEDASSRRGAAR